MSAPLLALTAALLAAPAGAATPLVPAADVADVGLQGWWQDGALLLGHPGVHGRPGVRPLDGLTPVVLPSDLSAWAEVGGDCVPAPESRATVDGRLLVARITATQEGPVVQVLHGERVVAHNALGRPARVCEVLLAQADGLPGVEVVVAWRMEGNASAAAAAGGDLEVAESEVADSDGTDAAASVATPARTAAAEVRGFTVYRLPEAAR